MEAGSSPLALYTGWEFSIAQQKVHFGRMHICHKDDLFTWRLFPYQATRRHSSPRPLIPLPTLNLPPSPNLFLTQIAEPHRHRALQERLRLLLLLHLPRRRNDNQRRLARLSGQQLVPPAVRSRAARVCHRCPQRVECRDDPRQLVELPAS